MNQRPYDLVIFDFDGTLADTFPWFASVLNDTAERFGFRRVAAEDMQLLRNAEPRAILANLGLPIWKLPMVASHMRARMSDDLDSLSLFEGVPRLLASLCEAGLDTALVTSNSEPNVRRMLGTDAAARIRHYVCGTAMFGKASKVKKLLARTGTATGRTILIGDEIRDLEAAQSVGVAFGAVSWGYNTRDAFLARRPTELFETIDEIAALLIGPRTSDRNSSERP